MVCRRDRPWATLALSMLLLGKPAAAAPEAGELSRLQRAAARRARLDDAPYTGLLARMRLAALFPDLTVSVWRGVQLGRPEQPTLLTADPDRMSFSVTARWDLGRMLFSRDELQIRAQVDKSAQRARALRAEVGRLYFRRAQALAENTDESLLRAEGLGAELEALTGEELEE